MQSQSNFLPTEVIHNTLCFLCPLDVLRLRLVSKRFRDITYDPVIWKTLYATAPLPLPPGPFSHQSTYFLERTLIRSAGLERTWTSHPIRAVRSECLDVPSLAVPGRIPRVVSGRWLITCESSRRIVLYDLDVDPDPDEETSRNLCDAGVQVIWEDEREVVNMWDACSMMMSEGLFVYFVFHPFQRPRLPWTLLEFRLNSNTGQVNGCVSLDVPVRGTPSALVTLVCDQAPFLYLRGSNLIFDTRTRMFYDFPGLSAELPVELRPRHIVPTSVLLTETYIVAFLISNVSDSRLVQAYTVPSDSDPTPTNGGSKLQLTHQGTIRGTSSDLFLIKQSSVDPITGTTTVRFLQLQRDAIHARALQFFCVDLELRKVSNHTNVHVVQPISIHEHLVFSVDNAGCDPSTQTSSTFIDNSPSGHARGLHLLYPKRTSTSPMPFCSFLALKFRIDASPKECTEVRGTCSPSTDDPEEVLFRSASVGFDGVRGRVMYGCARMGGRVRPGCSSVVMVDVR